MTSIHSDQQEQINQAVQEMKTELRTEFTAALSKKVVLLETHVAATVNEVCQDNTSTLEELKTTVVVVPKSQEKMWQAIDGMSKEV